MGSLVKFLAALLVGAFLILWGSVQHVPPVRAAASASGASTSRASTRVAGIVLYDRGAGLPGVPYLAYMRHDEKGRAYVATYRLVFPQVAPCVSYAGQYPCVVHEAATPLPAAGELLSVTGVAQEESLHVSEVERAAGPPEGMQLVSVRAGEQIAVSGSVLRLERVATEQACAVSTGCLREGTPRVVMSITEGAQVREQVYVPGQMYYVHGSRIALTSDPMAGVAIFLIVPGS